MGFIEMIHPEPLLFEGFYFQVYVPDAKGEPNQVIVSNLKKCCNYTAEDAISMTSLIIKYSHRSTKLHATRLYFANLNDLQNIMTAFLSWYETETGLHNNFEIMIEKQYVFFKNKEIFRYPKGDRLITENAVKTLIIYER